MSEVVAEQSDEASNEADERGPLRRCALTRDRRPKDDLIRFVLAPDGEIVPDLKERLPGRGVWVSAAGDSVAEAAKRNVFARALKAQVKVPTDLARRVETLLLEAALGAFALANKAGEVMFGFTKVEQAIAREKILALVHASDAAEDGCRKLDARRRAQTKGAEAPAIRVFTSDELDLASGRTNVIHAAIIHGRVGAKLLAAVSRLERYRTGGALVNRNGSSTDTA